MAKQKSTTKSKKATTSGRPKSAKSAAKTSRSKLSKEPSKSSASKRATKVQAGKNGTSLRSSAGLASVKPQPARAGVVTMVRELAAIVERRSLSELVVDCSEVTITLRRGGTASGEEWSKGIPTVIATPPPSAVSPQTSEPFPVSTNANTDETGSDIEQDSDHHVVTCPFVGTFYRRPTPDAEPYTAVGQRVQKGDVLCIVEAMKLMNEIEADISGTVAAILVEDAKPVEYGQPLYKIIPE